MPRGGRREGAGRKTQWVSGCSFPETTIIRVPKVLRNELLEIAHRLDAGEEIDLVSKSIKQRNEYLESKILELEKELNQSKQQPLQLELISSESDIVTKTKRQMNRVRDDVLKSLPISKGSPIYKDTKKTYDKFIGAFLEALSQS